MPIYEFYCSACHTVYSFFSSRVAPSLRPACPRCGRPELERKPSTFATLRPGRAGAAGEEEAEGVPGLDDQRIEGAMETLAGEMEGMGEGDDPRQLAHLFRRFGELSGMEAGPKMQEMLRRLESGEDPDSLEDEMDDLMGDEGEGSLEDFFRLKQAAGRRASAKPPRIDPTLYFL